MNRVVTHELIHAFDHCRARVDWFTDFRHLACSEVRDRTVCGKTSSVRRFKMSVCLFTLQIRAANLSGDCSFVNEVSRFNFGLKEHHQVTLLLLSLDCHSVKCCFECVWIVLFPQECVRSRALRSILAVRKVSREEAERVVDEVFDSCFSDHAPFGRIPHSKKDAKFAYRDFENRDRYYANL